MTVLLVAIGSALGGVGRYLVSSAFNASSGFPWGTFGVNVVGSLAIGTLSGCLAHASGNAAAVRTFAVVGFCGGFTTFSTFSNETFRMLENGQWTMLCAYVFGTLAAGLAATSIGYAISR